MWKGKPRQILWHQWDHFNRTDGIHNYTTELEITVVFLDVFVIQNRRCRLNFINSSPDPINMDYPSVLKKFARSELSYLYMEIIGKKNCSKCIGWYMYLLFLMNHNGIVLPFMVIDYKISNSWKLFFRTAHPWILYGGCSERGSRFQWTFALFLLILTFLRMLVILKISWHNIDVVVMQCIFKECNYQSYNI